jgi:hypothetical protein
VAKREVELRVALRGVAGRAALVLHAQIVGDELFYGSPFMGLGIRASYHADGKCHVYHPGGRSIAPPRAPLRQLRGSHLLSSGGMSMLHMLDWNYRIVSDKPNRRRTLVVDIDVVDSPTNVSLWAVEHGRHDLVEDVLSRPHFNILDHVVTEWTNPMLLSTVTKPTQDVWDTLNEAYLRDHPGASTPRIANPSDGTTGPWTLPKPPTPPAAERH